MSMSDQAYAREEAAGDRDHQGSVDDSETGQTAALPSLSWTIYSCGLRLQEGTHIQARDTDSGQGMPHVRHRLFRPKQQALGERPPESPD